MAELDQLRSVISSGQGVVVVGAGATAATTESGEGGSWFALIKSGLEFIELHDGAARNWCERLLADLELAKTSDVTDLLSVASRVAGRIHSYGAQAFANWLEQQVGALKPTHPDWIRAIHGLGAPVLTTNYDTLFETVSKRGTVDWTNPKAVQEALAGSGNVVHIHGVWTNLDSIVLSEVDYEKLRTSPAAQALQHGISATRSMVYIGCGATLEDPNFARLLNWHRQLFPVSGVQHFRFCRTSDLAELTEFHRNDNVRLIDYGNAYADLPVLLRTMAPETSVARTRGGLVRDAVGEAREYLLDQIRSETIVGEGLDAVEDKSLADLTIDPILLPVPHAELFKSRREGDLSSKRVDPRVEATTPGVLLVVGEESSGLSTAIRWLLLNSSTPEHQTAPVYLDFRRFTSSPLPLRKQLSQEAKDRGLGSGKGELFHDVIIGIDNFHVNSRTGQRVIDEIADLRSDVIIGCLASFEGEVAELLNKTGRPNRVRYIGKLGTSDIRAMAQIASRTRAEAIATLVVATLQSEHLPRTPFTVALLIAIALRGEAVVANASPTTILDQYVSHLLGRDDPDQDPRFTMTSTSRETVLTDLAEFFLEQSAGAVSQTSVVQRIQAFFERFGWKESPVPVLDDLVARRVLNYDGDNVRFSQSSFLHMFVAKSAIKNRAVIDQLLEQPLTYGAVLRAYAALVRNDAQVLSKVLELLDREWALNLDESLFSEASPRDAPEGLEAQLAKGLEQGEAAPLPPNSPAPDPLEHFDDQDVAPFPVTLDEDLNILPRLAQTVELTSAILRDSEEVDDLELKTRALEVVLDAWGLLADAYLNDEGFKDLGSKLAEQLQLLDSSAEVRELIESFTELFPGVLIWANISLALASRKLLVILDRAIEAGGIIPDARHALPAALLSQAIHEPGWDKQFASLVEPHKHTVLAHRFFWLLLVLEYEGAKSNSDEETRLRGLAVEMYLSTLRFKNDRERKGVGTQYRLRLEKDKRRSVAQQAIER